MKNKLEMKTLIERQKWPLEKKMRFTEMRIIEWYEHYKGKVYISFSGGLDSTVLLDMVRSLYPEVPAVFCDTGLEFPEIRDFVKTKNNVTWLKPKLTFKQILKKHGFPVVSKRNASYISAIRSAKGETKTKILRLTGVNSKGVYSRLNKLPKKWNYLIDAPFDISAKCCDVLKKNPMKRYCKKTGRFPYIGTRAEEAHTRKLTYIKYGCNAYDLYSNPRSTPLAFWTHADIMEYIDKYSLEYSKIYDMGYERTGCIFCMFGCHLEKPRNRFQILEKTHPKLHNYCMYKLGLKEVLEYMDIPYNNKKKTD
jgi:3'-phosphoadenosine 5'-phosphosulfate sulfotransferase (PAPS reductase)/FAD synthetase